MPPLILTATINPKNTPFVHLKNNKDRLIDYVCAIISYLKFSGVKEIVFCDNSNNSLNWSSLDRLADSYGKQIERLSFDGNQGSQSLGKGWGEGEIMEYAIKNSQIIKNHDFFFKSTGRIFIQNIDEIELKTEDLDNFFYSSGGGALSTLFFKSNKEFFVSNLMGIYTGCDDKNRVYLEYVYKKSQAAAFEIKNPSPVYVGRSGTSGMTYHSFYDSQIIQEARMFGEFLLN